MTLLFPVLVAEPVAWRVVAPTGIAGALMDGTAAHAGPPASLSIDWEAWTASTLDIAAVREPEPDARQLVRSLCHAAGLTRQQVGALVGVSRRAVTSWLSGDRPDAAHLALLSSLDGFARAMESHNVGSAHAILEPAYGHPRLSEILGALRADDLAGAAGIVVALPSTPPVEPSTIGDIVQIDRVVEYLAALAPPIPAPDALPPDRSPPPTPPPEDAPYSRRAGRRRGGARP